MNTARFIVRALQPVLPQITRDCWWQVRDGDASAVALFGRHYSRRIYADGRNVRLIVGPGEKLVLITADARALFAWRKFISDDGQQGVNCAIFRNEGHHLLASELIQAADAVAWKRWPGERHYTYVNPGRIRSSNPGYCFKMAGWRLCGETKSGLHILERCA